MMLCMSVTSSSLFFFFFFFNDPATTEIYTLSLHDALPILYLVACVRGILAGLGAVLIDAVMPYQVGN